MTSAFYPGASIDIVPPILFRSITQWYYMDSKPRSEFGAIMNKKYYKPQFIPDLLTVMNKNGFELQTVEDDIYTFYHPFHKQTIRYETNAVFPYSLQPYHRTCDTLVLIGYRLTNPPPNFISSYSHIITSSTSVYEESVKSLLLSKLVSTIVYDKKNKWEYWKAANLTIRNIKRYVTVTDRFLTYDEVH